LFEERDAVSVFHDVGATRIAERSEAADIVPEQFNRKDVVLLRDHAQPRDGLERHHEILLFYPVEAERLAFIEEDALTNPRVGGRERICRQLGRRGRDEGLEYALQDKGYEGHVSLMCQRDLFQHYILCSASGHVCMTYLSVNRQSLRGRADQNKGGNHGRADREGRNRHWGFEGDRRGDRARLRQGGGGGCGELRFEQTAT
jgi:hypothetical protein